MSTNNAGEIRYIEHSVIQSTAFRVVDKTMVWENRPQWSHDHEIWIDIGNGGRWFTPQEAEEFAHALMSIVAEHRSRHSRNVFAEELVAQG